MKKLIKAVKSSNPQRDGYYIADGTGTRREITYEQALEIAKNNPNLIVNYYKDNVGGTGRLHWDENQNQFIDNNESIRPIPKRISDTPGNKYMNEMDEIVTRAKTAVRYANENRLPGESLNAALERLTKEMDTADPNVPGDFKQLKLFFEENSLINFLQKFVGGIAIPATVAPVIINSEDTIRSQKHN